MSEAFKSPPSSADPDAVQRRTALGYLGEAWEEAMVEGLDPDCLAQAAIFLAFQELVAVYGEEPVADFAEALAGRVRAGQYTVERTRQ